jgi:ribonuclease E/ribonuclease G
LTRALVADRTGQGVRIALLEDRRLIEVDLAEGDSQPNGIYRGRVRAIAHGIDGAFVDCGLGPDAFLSARDARAMSGARRGTPISEQVSEGQAVLVQIKRLAQHGKGPRVGTDVALDGLCLVHRPRIGRIELTPELARSEHAKRQYARVAALFPAGGFSLRPAAMQASDAELLAEADQLRQRWAALESRAAALTPPAALDPPADLLLGLLRRHFSPDLERIVFAERTDLIKARGWLEQALPRWLEQGILEHLPAAFDHMGAAEQLEEALGREVALANGGTLIIERTAALTAIDVNGTGRPLDIDLAAVPEVARQLRLRGIGGNVVIDFVDLEARAEQARLGTALRAAFAGDPALVQVYPMSPLGLVELSRQHTGPGLAERLGR